MKVKIEKLKDWDLVYRMALYTQGKTPKKQYPSEEWKKKAVISQHSTLRQLEFLVIIEDVPNYVHNHLTRHVHLQPYVRTMREDITGISNDDITRNTCNNGAYIVNAQEIINVSKQRLCNKAAIETQKAWKKVVLELEKIEPLLAKMCVPECVAFGYCKEFEKCGLYHIERSKRSDYLEFVEK